MKKTKLFILTKNSTGYLIKDFRIPLYYFLDKPGIIRNFEKILGSNISLHEATKLVAEDANVLVIDIKLNRLNQTENEK